MKPLLSLVVCVCLAGLMLTDSGVAGTPGDTANTKCPISKMAVDGSTVTTVGDAKIGFCCTRCQSSFEKWDDARKSRYVVSLGIVQDEPQKAAKPAGKKEVAPYTLATCPVSGMGFETKGDPVVKEYDGREVRFCCGGCVGRFEADKKGHFEKIDKKMIKAQMAYYPIDTCFVMDGEPLVEDGEDISVNMIYNNRLYRFCCKACVRKFKKDPVEWTKALDRKIIEQQREAYPLDTCVVGGGNLGSMGDPYEIIVGNRLVRFCCKGCEGSFKKNPAKYLAEIDKAWKKKGFPGAAATAAGAE